MSRSLTDSGASSSSSAAACGQVVPSGATVSDLLIKGASGGSYQIWINAIRDEVKRTQETTISRKIQGAQVTLWQFFATRHREPAPNQKKNLPQDTRGIICEFLGPVDFGGKAPSVFELQNISRSARLNDTARAVAYYVDLAAAAARTGLHEVTITEDIFNAAPKLAADDGPVPMDVIAQVLELEHYAVTDGEGRLRGEEFDPGAFPMTITFGASLGTYYALFGMDFHAKSASEVQRYLRGPRPVGASSASVSGPGFVATSSAPWPGGPVGAFIKTMEKAIDKAAEAVEQKIHGAFASGDVEWALTKENWEKMEQKLPNGKPVPFFKSDLTSSFMSDLTKVPERLTVLESLRAGVAKRGVFVWPSWTLDGDDDMDVIYGFPVRFQVNMRESA